MPPPRLPRHLRPCRPLWSGRQVRFASDKPSDTPAGGDGAKRTVDGNREPTAQDKQATQQDDQAPRPLQIHIIDRPAPPSTNRWFGVRSFKRTAPGETLQQVPAEDAATASTPAQPTTTRQPLGEPSLLDELFPAASKPSQPRPDRRPAPPKLALPTIGPYLHVSPTPAVTRTNRQKVVDAFRARGEPTAVLQLSHCSTALTEADFRRLVPRGAHIEAWAARGEFYKIIPGRDPLSLARLPFYYLLFRSPDAALAYQKNASRLSKLAALHAASSVASAIAPPRGFLEDGEDVAAVTARFVLHPRGHALDLRSLMQPYNPVLRSLIDAGGYNPIVSAADAQSRPISRVLLAINGYEPGHRDLWQMIARHAHARGIIWPFRDDNPSALRRLRDVINLNTVPRKFQATASSNPRAANTPQPPPADTLEYEDPSIAAFVGPLLGDAGAKEMNQLVMNRVYNRWILEFEDADAARRFAGLWHRTRLADLKRDGSWKDTEEDRWVSAEFLW